MKTNCTPSLGLNASTELIGGCVKVAYAVIVSTTDSALVIIGSKVFVYASSFNTCSSRSDGGGIRIETRPNDAVVLSSCCFQNCSTGRYGSTFSIWRSANRVLNFTVRVDLLSCIESKSSYATANDYTFMILGGLEIIRSINSSFNELNNAPGFRIGGCLDSKISYSIISNNIAASSDFPTISTGLGATVDREPVQHLEYLIIQNNQDVVSLIDVRWGWGQCHLKTCVFRNNDPPKLSNGRIILDNCYFDKKYEISNEISRTNLHFGEQIEIEMTLVNAGDCQATVHQQNKNHRLVKMALLRLIYQ